MIKGPMYCPLLVLVVVLSFCSFTEPSETSRHACERLDVMFTYMGVQFRSRDYQAMHPNPMSYPTLDAMLTTGSGFNDRVADLVEHWIELCHAQDPEEDISLWRNLTQEMDHKMYSDLRLFDIVELLFGDQMGSWFMNPPPVLLHSTLHDSDCVEQLLGIFVKHCGPLSPYGLKNVGTLAAFCTLGVKNDEFTDVSSQICGYYINNQGQRR